MSAVVAPLRGRLQALTQLRCTIFNTIYNPNSLRTGSKYLRARLRGQSMVDYYPQGLSFKDVHRIHPELKLVNFGEEQRLYDVDQKKKRGKGTPKKAKTKEDSRRQAKKKRK